MSTILKNTLKKVFHTVGLDLKRLDPAELNKFVWLTNQNIKTILDIGANTGQFARMIHEVLPEAKVYSFEPLQDCYEELVEKMKGVPNFKAFNVALGAEDGETEIHRSEFSPSSSLLPMGDLHKRAFPQTSRETLERISVKRLDGMADLLTCDGGLLVKLDVQGYEDQVIAGGYETFRKAKVIIIETSFQVLYNGQPLFAAMFDMLRRLGFAYRGNLDQLRNPLDGSVLQSDSIFIREKDNGE